MNVPATLFEKFEISSCLKQDEFSAVYLARHVFLGKEIVLKVLNTHAMREQIVLERFKREARILARLEHPNIIKVIDFGMFGKDFYISFEYFPSRNLRQTMSEKELTDADRRVILGGLLEALHYAHRAGIVHRDIKPENVLVGADYLVKLSDFGLAEMNTDSLVTDKFGLVGTPGYMSPEQIRGETLTPRSDLFACGIIGCELYLGIHPFLGRDINESLNAIVGFEEEAVFAQLTELPEELGAVLRGLLRKRAGDRWETAEAALHQLGLSATTSPAFGTRVIGLLNSPLHRRRVFVTAGVFVVVLSAGVFAWNTMKEAAQPGVQPLQQGSADSIRTTSESATPLSGPGPAKTPPNTANNANIEGKTGTSRMEGNERPYEKASSSAIPANTSSASPVQFGELYVECLPWARVSVDSVDLETTPLKRNLRLSAGTHLIELTHPKYPSFTASVTISPNGLSTVKVNLDTLFGYVGCEAFPWGELYIDGAYVDRTPMRPTRVVPGRHRMILKNAAFQPLEREIVVTKSDTTWIRHRFTAAR